MPKISEDRRSERRRQIAQAGLRCFIRKGFEATSMADIISEAGLSAGGIYIHYENKQDLVRQVISDVLEERNAAFSELSLRNPLPDPAEVIREFVGGIRRDQSKADIQLHLWSACLREPSLAALFEEYAAQLRRMFQSYLEAWLVQSGLTPNAAAEYAAPLAQIVTGIRQGFVVQSALVPDFDPDSFLEALTWINFAPPKAAAQG